MGYKLNERTIPGISYCELCERAITVGDQYFYSLNEPTYCSHECFLEDSFEKVIASLERDCAECPPATMALLKEMNRVWINYSGEGDDLVDILERYVEQDGKDEQGDDLHQAALAAIAKARPTS